MRALMLLAAIPVAPGPSSDPGLARAGGTGGSFTGVVAGTYAHAHPR